MPDGSKWDVPVTIIASHRAEHYKQEFGGDVHKSLNEDTLPLFESDPFEIADWAANNMNWSDVERVAKLADIPKPDVDFQYGWVNGKKELL